MVSERRPPRVTVLCGGLGGARLAMAMREARTSADAVFITNVADDWTVGRLPVCPDTDAVLYALTGRFDDERGWGVRGDVFPGPRADEPSWFSIGRLDRAIHQRRRALRDAGATLAEATATLTTEAGADARVIPVSSDSIRTRIRSGDQWLAFQEWMVRERGPRVDDIRWDGLQRAQPSNGVIDALVRSDLVVIASSSPLASLAPVLGVAGVRHALAHRSGPTLALSPMVLGRPAATDRDRHRDTARRQLLAAAGIDNTPVAIATWLAPVVSHFALDPTDDTWCAAVADTGAIPLLAPVIGMDADERASLLDLFASLRGFSRTTTSAMVATS